MVSFYDIISPKLICMAFYWQCSQTLLTLEHKIGEDGCFTGNVEDPSDDVLLEKINVYFNELQVNICLINLLFYILNYFII